MDPQQPVDPLPPTMPASGQPYTPHNPSSPNDPYRFIMESPKKPKSSRLPGVGGNPLLTKIVLFLGGTIILMIVAAIAVNIFFGNKTNIQDIVDIAVAEQEIIRVSGKGSDATDQSIKNAAVTTQTVVTTHQKEWSSFLAAHGRKIDPKELAAKKSAATDARLTQAQATSTFNEAFTQIMRGQLQTYATQLQSAYTKATNSDEKALLKKDLASVSLLLEQWPDGSIAPAQP